MHFNINKFLLKFYSYLSNQYKNNGELLLECFLSKLITIKYWNKISIFFYPNIKIPNNLSIIRKTRYGGIYKYKNKIIRKSIVNKHHLWRIFRELLLIKYLNYLDTKNEHIIKLYGGFIYQKKDKYISILIMEKAEGDLLDIIKKYRKFNKEIFIKNIITNVKFLHNNGIYHRDIKPENILFTDKLVLTDFEFSVFISENIQLSGTPCYISPESYNTKKYYKINYSNDIYAISKTIMFILYNKSLFLWIDKSDIYTIKHAISYYNKIMNCYSYPVFINLNIFEKIVFDLCLKITTEINNKYFKPMTVNLDNNLVNNKYTKYFKWINKKEDIIFDIDTVISSRISHWDNLITTFS